MLDDRRSIFPASSDASDASIEITEIGKGNFHVCAVSLMPADSIDGFRPDTFALLKQFKSGFWGFGGNYTSNCYWCGELMRACITSDSSRISRRFRPLLQLN